MKEVYTLPFNLKLGLDFFGCEDNDLNLWHVYCSLRVNRNNRKHEHTGLDTLGQALGHV